MNRDGELQLTDETTAGEFHFFQGLPDLFTRRLAEYLDIEETTSCLLAYKTLNQIAHDDFFPAWQQKLLNEFKIPFDISETLQSPHIVYRRFKILSRQICDPEFNLYQKIRYAFSAPGFSPFTMPWLFYPFNCDANKDFISQLNKDGRAFQEYYLQMACRVGNLSFVQFLYENYYFKLNSKHLNYACASGKKDLVRYCTDIHKNTPTTESLNFAVCSGNVDLVDYFLNTARIEANDQTYIRAEASGNRKILRLLLQKYGNNDHENFTYITGCILKSGIAVPGDQLLFPAGFAGVIPRIIDGFLSEKTMTLDFVVMLIKQAQFVPTLKTLDKALNSGHIDLVISLILYLKKTQGNFVYDLNRCALTGDIDFVREVIRFSKQKPTINWLRNAIFSGNIELVKYLIKKYALDPKKIDFSLDGLRNKDSWSEFLFCHVPMAKFLIEELGCAPIESKFEYYIQGNNLPVAYYLFTQCRYQWGNQLFPKASHYTDPLTKNIIAWTHNEDEAQKMAYYEDQMPFISLVASACGQDPQNPLRHEVEEDWDLMFKKAFLKTYEFDGYDSISKEYIPAFPDDPNQKYTFNPKDLTFWTVLSIFFGIPSRPEKGSKEGAIWTWRQTIRNFFGGWNPILFDDKTDEDNIQGKVLLNLILITVLPVKIGIALFKCVTLFFKTALNTLKLFTEFLPLLGYKILKKRGVDKIVKYGFISTIATGLGFFSRMYYMARYYLALCAFFIAISIIAVVYNLNFITLPEKCVRLAWYKVKKLIGRPILRFILGSLFCLGSLIVSITFLSYIVAAIWFFAIPSLVTHFPILISLCIAASHYPLIAPVVALIQAKITIIWALYSYFTIPLLVAPIVFVLTLFSKLSDMFSNAWAQWIPEKQNFDNKDSTPTPQFTHCNDTKTNKLEDINNSNVNPSSKDLVAEAQAASQEAQNAAINADRRSCEIASETIIPSANSNTPPAAAEELQERLARAPG